MEIEIDEWRAAQEKAEAVSVQVSWREVREDPAIAALFAGLPERGHFVRINLLDGRVTLAPQSWKGLRFGKGPTIYEAARGNFEAWSGGRSFLDEARESDTGKMVRRLVPDFDGYTEKEQADFLIRTQRKIDGVWQSAADLAKHLQYAAPDRHKAIPPIKGIVHKVRAAVFSDVLKSTRRAGEILGVAGKDKIKHENQTVRKRAMTGRALLHGYYGKSEYEAMVARMQQYHHWWKWFDSIEDPREQMYVLLAEARGTSAEHEQLRAADDGFAEKLEEWVGVVERRLEASEASEQSENPAKVETARQRADQLWAKQIRIQKADARFEKALSLASLEAPAPSIA